MPKNIKNILIEQSLYNKGLKKNGSDIAIKFSLSKNKLPKGTSVKHPVGY